MLELHTAKEASQWLRGRVTGRLHADSRKVLKGDGFIAWPGAATDGRHHVRAAIHAGAQACLVERLAAEAFKFDDDNVCAYRGLKEASGPIASAYFENPSAMLDVVAITGTNGKTSTAWWLALALSNKGSSKPLPCGHIGTLGMGLAKAQPDGDGLTLDLTQNGLTTPDPVALQCQLREFVKLGVKACVIEASSIGLEEHRLDGTRLHTAVLTNFTQDHLDYHGSMAAYWQAKLALFKWPNLKAAVVNLDDAKGRELAQWLERAGLDLWTVSCHTVARLRATDIHWVNTGLEFGVVEGNERHHLSTRMIGHYNVENVLCVIAAMRSLGVPLADCVASCRTLRAVPGRMEHQEGPQGGLTQPWVTIDYAHTPDALQKALRALQPLAQQRGGKLWCVFGCGGDRDAVKRPQMGHIAASEADHVVVTNDNPRSEPPQSIVDQIVAGMKSSIVPTVEMDRSVAIQWALSNAVAEDVVLVAGKGHENYQEKNGVRLPFSDAAEVARALRRRVVDPLGKGPIP